MGIRVDYQDENKPLPGKISGGWATAVGAATAVIAFIGPQMPDNTPEWVELGVGALGAALAFLGGYSHPGYGQKHRRRQS